MQEQKQKDKRGAGSFTVAPAQYTCPSHVTMSSTGGKAKVPSIGVELRPYDTSAKRSAGVSKQFGRRCQEARSRR